MNRDLTAFIEHARTKGMDHATIRVLLLSAGWKEKDVAQALTEQALEMPVPVPPDTGGAREAFLHLLTFAAFYTSVIAAVVLFFQFINRLFPDPALPQYDLASSQDLSTIRWSVAVVIVAFPFFLWLSRLLLREMRAHPERSSSGVHRWLTYLTLLAASLALGGDVIALVFRFLEGELSIRFLLKVLVVLVIAGLSFAYYLLSLRMAPEKPETTTMHRSFFAAANVLVATALVWGFVLAGSPITERLRKFDDRRIEDLEVIQDEIVSICLGDERSRPPEERKLRRPIPRTLSELVEAARVRRPAIRDPETGEPYGYEVLGESGFRLCASFRFPRDEKYRVSWNHPAGRQCFEFDALRPE